MSSRIEQEVPEPASLRKQPSRLSNIEQEASEREQEASEREQEASERARNVFASLARSADGAGGAGGIDIEAAAAEHPELAAELRELHAGWVRPGRLLGSIRVDSSVLDSMEHAGCGIDASFPYDDGWPEAAPVSSLEPNPWGFHHVLGNVAEWTASAYGEVREGLATVRGGSFRSSVRELRAASRAGVPLENRSAEIGIRPARELDGPLRE